MAFNGIISSQIQQLPMDERRVPLHSVSRRAVQPFGLLRVGTAAHISANLRI